MKKIQAVRAAQYVSLTCMMLLATSAENIYASMSQSTQRSAAPASKPATMGQKASQVATNVGNSLARATGYNSQAGKLATSATGIPAATTPPASAAPTVQGGWNFSTVANKATANTQKSLAKVTGYRSGDVNTPEARTNYNTMSLGAQNAGIAISGVVTKFLNSVRTNQKPLPDYKTLQPLAREQVWNGTSVTDSFSRNFAEQQTATNPNGVPQTGTVASALSTVYHTPGAAYRTIIGSKPGNVQDGQLLNTSMYDVAKSGVKTVAAAPGIAARTAAAPVRVLAGGVAPDVAMAGYNAAATSASAVGSGLQMAGSAAYSGGKAVGSAVSNTPGALARTGRALATATPKSIGTGISSGASSAYNYVTGNTGSTTANLSTI